MKGILARIRRAAAALLSIRPFGIARVATPRREATQVGWPEGEVRDAQIFIASYPFVQAAVFPGGVAIPASRVTAIFDSITDAAFVLDGNEIIFLRKQNKSDLQAFASRHNIPCPNIHEVWSVIAAPYLDTAYSAEEEGTHFQSLAERGYEATEVRALRRDIGSTMLAATWFTFEWGLYTTQDVLRAFAVISPREFTEELYWKVMEVALRPYRKVDPEAASRLAHLRAFWDTAWSELRLAPPQGLFARITGRYLEPQRFYHTLRHLQECFALFDVAQPLCASGGEVLLALWFHDAIYQPKSRDSEAASARWAERTLREAGAAADVIGRVSELILATKHDAGPVSADACVLVDIDLAILGSAASRFDEYETQIRQEYAHVPDLLFRMGRAKILKQFLARPWIYSTSTFRERFERPARDNLQRSVARL
jgi:predicted metal-dependent HD superfamily phosphohydrolase